MNNIKKYEAMVKLDLPEEERKQISDLAYILIESFCALKNLDTDNTDPMFTVLDVQNVLRDDVSVKLFARDELLANAPVQCDGYFQVPKALW